MPTVLDRRQVVEPEPVPLRSPEANLQALIRTGEGGEAGYPPGRLTRAGFWGRLLVVMAAMIGAVLEVLDTSITNVAVPQMMGNLGATLSEIGWVSTGYIISNVIVLPMTGWLADRFGRRAYFTASISIFTVASALCGLSHALDALIFWRVIQGLGGGGLLATGQVIMLNAFPQSQQGIATAIFGMGVMIGPSLGPVLGGWLTDNLSWPWIFFINIPFGIVAVALTLLYVPAERKPAEAQNSAVDVLGMTLLAVGMGSLQTVLERGQEDDWLSSRLIVWLSVIAAVSLIAFVVWELHNPHPVVNLRVFRHRSMAMGSLFGLVLGVGLYATLFLLPVYLQNSQGYTALESGMVMLPGALLSMVSFAVAGPLSQQVDARRLMLMGTLLMAFGSLGLSFLTTDSGNDQLCSPMLLRGLSMGFLFIPLTISSLAGLDAEEMGVGSGMINLARQLGGSVGIAALSTMLSRRAELHWQAVSAHLNPANPAVQMWLGYAEAHLVAAGRGPAAAQQGAMALLSQIAQRQSMILSFDDCFLAIAAAFFAALLLIPLMERPRTDMDISRVH